MNTDQARKILTAPAGSYRYDAIRAAQAALLDELEQFRAVGRRIVEAHREGWTPILQDDADELARLTGESSR